MRECKDVISRAEVKRIVNREGVGMTREEQLDWLCRLRSELKIYMPIEWVDHFEDALTESINTLSQELCDDAVSRKDIQDYIAKYLSQYLYDDVRQAVEAIDTYIGDMPSVTQKPGKRLDKKYYYECSQCGLRSYLGDSNFCPNCGAKMKM